MKVLLITRIYSDRDNPVGNFEFDQAIALKKLGIQVRIIGIDQRTIIKSRCFGLFFKEVDGIPVTYLSVPCRLLNTKIKNKIAQVGLSFLYNRLIKLGWIPDIVHAHFGVTAYGAKDIVDKYKPVFIITEHFSGMNTLTPNKELLNMCKEIYTKADLLISVSSALKDNIKILTNLDSIVVPNLLDPIVFTKLRANNGFIHRDRIKIISVGNLVPIKNFKILIDALANIKMVDYELHIYGSGNLKKQLLKQIAKYSLDEKIIIHEPVSRDVLYDKYIKSDAFILLSKRETFGVAYIEAMACGLPVASIRCGGTDDTITDKTGIIIDSTDVFEISKKIEIFLTTLNKYNKNDISEYAINNFGYEKIAKKLITCYRRLLYQ